MFSDHDDEVSDVDDDTDDDEEEVEPADGPKIPFDPNSKCKLRATKWMLRFLNKKVGIQLD